MARGPTRTTARCTAFRCGVSLVAPAGAGGTPAIGARSQAHPPAGTDFYRGRETSDVPAGVINIVTGERDALAKVLAEHDDVEAMWYVGGREGVKAVDIASAANMKRTWATWEERDGLAKAEGEGAEVF